MDRKSLVTVVVVALVLTTLVFPSTALAGNIFKFRGQSADAFFSSVDETGIQTDVFVFASDDVSQSPPGPGSSSSGAFVGIFRFDSNCPPWSEECPPALVDAFGFASLADQDFQVKRKLSSATLEATINVFDNVSGSSFDVLVDLTWTGSGPLSRQNNHFHFQSPGCIINGRFTGSFRSAEVSGTVSDGLTNFTPESGGGSIQSARNGEVSVGCGF